jgi:glyoxylase-like metal-dependent hydrolase (beta-lactamase superfamily II)
VLTVRAVDLLRPRLWYWTARHPDWAPDKGGEDGWEPDVGCYAYVAPDGGTLVLVDPLVPAGDEDAFWRALDGHVEHHGPPNVLITVFFHARSAQEILDRYARARVWAYAPAREELSKWTRVTDVYELGDPLPAGIEAHPTGGDEHEVAYRLPEYDALVVGDAMIAAPGAAPRVWPQDESVRTALRALRERPVDLLLLTHGAPVLADGGGALARALAG